MDFEASSIPAQVYVQLLQPNFIPKYTRLSVQIGHGFFGNIFAALTRGARSVIAPTLTKIGKSVVQDVLSGEDFQASSIKRTAGAVRDLMEQSGEGRRRRRKKNGRKRIASLDKLKRRRRTKKHYRKRTVRKSESSRRKTRKKGYARRKIGIPLSKLVQQKRLNPFAA